MMRRIRVNDVALGPSGRHRFPLCGGEDAHHGTQAPTGRPCQHDEVVPCYIFLASQDAAYMAGQVLHPNGEKAVNRS
jgi:NAD(P)-dependent dehydrogenase (short-subunit alcohol dehydrogenase family)